MTDKNDGKKKKALSLFFSIAVITIIAVLIYIAYNSTHISTDDAFIDGHIYTIASKIPGTVKSVYADDNQLVKKGDLLVEIDPVDYQVKVNETDAAFKSMMAKINETDAEIEAEKKQISQILAQIGVSKANLELQKANLAQAEIDKKRDENLYSEGGIPKDKYERALTNYKISLAQVEAANEQLKQADVSLDVQNEMIKKEYAVRNSVSSTFKQQKSVLEEANLNLGYTKIYATTDGYISKKSVEKGNQIQAGQPLMAIVPLNGIWITANYKETQITKIRPGQKVQIKIDAYPDKVFTGKVDSIMSGTGNVFSLFPPENATGNYIKVVQRISIKIVFDETTDTQNILRVGMSVVPTILVGKK